MPVTCVRCCTGAKVSWGSGFFWYLLKNENCLGIREVSACNRRALLPQTSPSGVTPSSSWLHHCNNTWPLFSAETCCRGKPPRGARPLVPCRRNTAYPGTLTWFGKLSWTLEGAVLVWQSYTTTSGVEVESIRDILAKNIGKKYLRLLE